MSRRVLVCGMSGTGKSTVAAALVRLATRDTNPFGKEPAQLERIRADVAEVERVAGLRP